MLERQDKLNSHGNSDLRITALSMFEMSFFDPLNDEDVNGEYG